MCENIQVTNYCPDDAVPQPEVCEPVSEVYIFRRPGTTYELVRVVFIEGKPWFVVSDICASMGKPIYRTHKHIIQEDTTFYKCYVSSIFRRMRLTSMLIDVSGIYTVAYKVFGNNVSDSQKEYINWLLNRIIPNVTTEEHSNLEHATGYLATITINNNIEIIQKMQNKYVCVDLKQVHTYIYPKKNIGIRTIILDNDYYFAMTDVGKCIDAVNITGCLARKDLSYDKYTKTCCVGTQVKNVGMLGGRKINFTNYAGLHMYSETTRNPKIHDFMIWLKYKLLPSLPKPQPEPTQPVSQPEPTQPVSQPEPTQSKNKQKQPELTQPQPQSEQKQPQPTTETSTMANDILLAVQDILNKQYKQAKIQYTYPGEYYPIPKSSQKAESLENTLDAISLEMGYGIKIDANKVKSWHEDMWDILNKREQAMDIVRAARKHE